MLLINEENDHTCDFILKYYENNNSLYEPPCRYFDNNLHWLQCLPTFNKWALDVGSTLETAKIKLIDIRI